MKPRTVSHGAPHPKLGLLPRVMTPFVGTDPGVPPVELCYLDYALTTTLRLTNTSSQPLLLMDLIVNHAFEPGAELAEGFRLFRYPVQLEPGCAFEAILQPPTAAKLPLDCAYPKLPETVVVSTHLGLFNFQAKGG